jgi:hypothetical protein
MSWSGEEILFRYADDTSIVVSNKDPIALKSIAEGHITRICHWFTTNNFIVNPDKTQLLLLGRSPSAACHIWKDFHIQIGTTNNIFPSDTIKLLGVTIDKQLKLHEHTAQVTKHVGFATKLASLNKKFMNAFTRKMMLSAYVMPHIDYCGVLTLNVSKAQWAKIERSVYRCHRILNLRKNDAKELVQETKVRLVVRLMAVFFGMICGRNSLRLGRYIERIETNTRACIPLRLPLAKTSFLQNALFTKCTRLWNKLPCTMDALKTGSNVRKFASELRKLGPKILQDWF